MTLDRDYHKTLLTLVRLEEDIQINWKGKSSLSLKCKRKLLLRRLDQLCNQLYLRRLKFLGLIKET